MGACRGQRGCSCCCCCTAPPDFLRSLSRCCLMETVVGGKQQQSGNAIRTKRTLLASSLNSIQQSLSIARSYNSISHSILIQHPSQSSVPFFVFSSLFLLYFYFPALKLILIRRAINSRNLHCGSFSVGVHHLKDNNRKESVSEVLTC